MLPTQRVQQLIVDRVAYILERPEREIGSGRGLARTTHVAAFIERTVDAYFENDVHDNTPGFFPKSMRGCIERRLANAHLQPEESRFADILSWKAVHKDQLRMELRTNLLRLLRENPQPYGIVGLELHVLLDLRMKYNAPDYQSAIEVGDYKLYPHLWAIMNKFSDELPELRRAA